MRNNGGNTIKKINSTINTFTLLFFAIFLVKQYHYVSLSLRRQTNATALEGTQQDDIFYVNHTIYKGQTNSALH